MKRMIFILFLFIVGFSQCKKEKPTAIILNIDDYYKNMIFEKNSYWVYENSLSYDLDSIILSKTEHDFYWNPPPVHDNPGTQREFYKMVLTSKSKKYEYVDFIDSYGLRRNPETEWCICGRLIYSKGAQKNFEYLNSLTINGKVFYNVSKCSIIATDYSKGCSNSGFEKNTDIYIADSFGIIRKVIHGSQSDTTWNLIRWHIIKGSL